MQTFLVLASKQGQPIAADVVQRLTVSCPKEILFSPKGFFSWTNTKETIKFLGWQTATNVFSLHSHWDDDGAGLTSFSGYVWPIREGWDNKRSWAKQLAAYLRRNPPPDSFEHFSGNYTIAWLPQDQTGYLMPDPLGSHLLYHAENQNMVVFSNRATLAALAVADSSLPERDVHNLGWMAFFEFVVGSGTSLKGVNVLPQGYLVRIEPDGRSYAESPFRPAWLGEKSEASWDESLQNVTHNLLQNIQNIASLPATEKISQLSGGKDSRLILALLIAANRAQDFTFHTFGLEHAPDVVLAKRIANQFGLKLQYSPAGQANMDPAQFENRLLHHVWQTQGMLGAFTLKGGVARTHRLTLSGLYGELFRSHYAAQISLRNENEVFSFFSQKMGFNAGEFVRKEYATAYTQWLRQWILEQIDMGARPEDIPDIFYLTFRLRRWFGMASESSLINPQAHPLQTVSGTRIAFALGHESRQIDKLHFEIMRRVAPDLTKVPFANDVWNQKVYEHLPDAKDYLKIKPFNVSLALRVTPQATIWQELKWRENMMVLEKYLVDDPSNPLFEVVDYERVRQVVTKCIPIPRKAKTHLYALLAAAVWLRRAERPIYFA